MSHNKKLPLLTGLTNFRFIKYVLLALLLPTQIHAGDQPEDSALPKHHTNEGFQNDPKTEEPADLGLRFYWNRFIASFDHPDVQEGHFVSETEAMALFTGLANQNTITWIGQSTLLIRIGDVVILTDPFFSRYASPYNVGPSRYIAPGIKPENLPAIDIILVSHNHYDHLDEAFVEAVPNKDNVHVFVPLKLGSFFSERGYKNIHELDWYGSKSTKEILVTALPSVHYSGRTMSDRNKTLWCSWAISSPAGQYLFIGDSAYSPKVFEEIGNKFGWFDLAMVPIGTYGNRKYGVNNHTTPEEAVLALF